jgi:cyclophilin family peptidyl-prolyl cis-trans isomerase
MIKPLAGAALVGALVVTAGAQQPSRPLSPAEAEREILAIEDRRLQIDPDLRGPTFDAVRIREALDVKLLLDLSRSDQATTQRRAVVALGRYERRELAPHLIDLIQTGPRSDVMFSLAQALRGPVLPLDETGQQVRVVFDAITAFARQDPRTAAGFLPAAVRAVGRLPYASPGQAQAAHAFLVDMFGRVDPDPDLRPILADVADAAESLARLNRQYSLSADETNAWLRRLVESRRRTYAPAIRVAAIRALVTARAVDLDTLRLTIGDVNSDELRRLATISLAAGVNDLNDVERTLMVLDLLNDRAQGVRIEAVRAWARTETDPTVACPRLLEVLRGDPSVHVRTVTIGLLATACPADPDVTNLLVSLLTMRSPRAWHDAAHAMVALARRAPMRLEAPLRTAFVKHPDWHVRMYAARAAAIMDDLSVLERLGYDPHHNVREATLAALKRLKGQEAEPYFADALRQTDYQLLRTAARELAGIQPTPSLAAALASALTRVTADRSETSRDVRLALLARLIEFGDAHNTGAVVPLLRDFDIPVAQAAAATLHAWSGDYHEIDPQLLQRPPIRVPGSVTLEVNMAAGPSFDIRLLPSVAPITSGRFLELANRGYYDGLTFHRVVPNFVIQGGSPGANEYVGHHLYTRDERSSVSHRRGTVGLSTRGRDTGDMQFFINLVDNPRLDYEYTVFGRISPSDMARVERILEGDVITSIRVKEEKK